MENLKIKVNNEAESKEAQSLGEQLGYVRPSGYMSHARMKKGGYVCLGFDYEGEHEDIILFIAGFEEENLKDIKHYKEITLPELRDRVILKRNCVDDATHYCKTVQEDKGYLSSDNLEYFWSYKHSEWQLANIHTSFSLQGLKPIKKEKEMKEYLNPLKDGGYELSNNALCEDSIEVPEGADSYIRRHQERKPHFRKSIEGKNFLFCSDGVWRESWRYPHEIAETLWKRDKMKEYLFKFNNTYTLVNLKDAPNDEQYIEVPKGADTLAGRKNGDTCYFWDHNKMKIIGVGESLRRLPEWEDIEKSAQEWVDEFDLDYGINILWQRTQQPESMPFVDDETEYLNQGKNGERLMHSIEQLKSRETLSDKLKSIEVARQSAWDKQEGGSHYKKLAIQPMEYALKNKLDYAQANVVKYVTRHADKNGKEDLLKAIHNIELMIEHYYP